jgi:hypothetical protein
MTLYAWVIWCTYIYFLRIKTNFRCLTLLLNNFFVCIWPQLSLKLHFLIHSIHIPLINPDIVWCHELFMCPFGHTLWVFFAYKNSSTSLCLSFSNRTKLFQSHVCTEINFLFWALSILFSHSLHLILLLLISELWDLWILYNNVTLYPWQWRRNL